MKSSLRDCAKRVPGLRRGYTLAQHLRMGLNPRQWAGGGWTSYSQHGEDMVARALLKGLKGPQTFIDVGARHPVQDSNTYFFYRQGWRGLNIDAMPGSMQLFEYLRPRDINVEACVGTAGSCEVAFWIYDSPGYNTASRERMEQLGQERPDLQVREVRRMPVRSLSDLVDEYLPDGGRGVALMSVDVESLDEAVLDSNDWERCRPRVVMFEANNVGFDELSSDALVGKMCSRGYEVVGLAGPTVVMSRC